MEDDQRIRELCELTSKEQDTEKLLQFVTELNQLLEVKEKRLLVRQNPSIATSAD